MACDKCRDYGGLWMMTAGGLKRCECLPALEKPVANPPVLTVAQAIMFAEAMAAIPFFPAEAGPRAAIADELRSLCAGLAEADWLVKRMRRLYRRWPGTIDMRHVYCSKFHPWDGVQPSVESEVYPNGIPSERETNPLQLGAPGVKLLSDGRKEEAIADPAIRNRVAQVAAAMPKMRTGASGTVFGKILAEALTAPQDRPPQGQTRESPYSPEATR